MFAEPLLLATTRKVRGALVARARGRLEARDVPACFLLPRVRLPHGARGVLSFEPTGRPLPRGLEGETKREEDSEDGAVGARDVCAWRGMGDRSRVDAILLRKDSTSDSSSESHRGSVGRGSGGVWDC